MRPPNAHLALTSASNAFILNLSSRSRSYASIQSSSTLPSITVVSGMTKLSTRNLQKLLWPIWACMQLQHCESGNTFGGGSGHLRPVASDSAHRVMRAAVRAWPHECMVAWVVWHISSDFAETSLWLLERGSAAGWVNGLSAEYLLLARWLAGGSN
jgi:hypothetical protein